MAIDREGYVVDSPQGGVKANPRCGIMHQMHNRRLSILRALALTVIQTNPDHWHDQGRENQRGQESRQRAGRA